MREFVEAYWTRRWFRRTVDMVAYLVGLLIGLGVVVPVLRWLLGH